MSGMSQEVGPDPLVDYICNISCPLFGIPCEEFPSLLAVTEDTKYALSKFATEAGVMAIYVEWKQGESGDGMSATANAG